jgi:hypothetical protein
MSRGKHEFIGFGFALQYDYAKVADEAASCVISKIKVIEVSRQRVTEQELFTR